ncbi:MAG: hypothetical protein A3F24_02870 [Candidatus Colwellbacteria bacterium RIFCSPHIGHO2_12_FULL_44_17]|uniref:Uncharacterized protein n=1 Tax=Candidatus Colwellbacteria bacterium RIFCSPHIGHO2_12_FULL_44_17 TaxID=1797689 RepID=A0A1G1Z3W3_9BACT|nr:MAG: hypothetical protein A3F24_02870 [Candidatus Colwellbacteria bacterium RIFCSPHIGHO2_12_FULL_44_17]
MEGLINKNLAEFDSARLKQKSLYYFLFFLPPFFDDFFAFRAFFFAIEKKRSLSYKRQHKLSDCITLLTVYIYTSY